ncbi:succinate dehydrogenase/fumarate reductase iron-sulfur subunit [Bacteriovorax stolpii]|uniref:Succinate dehydrogenase/fumarate reductase iron-sulfur subunit n=1 Tax=Bacteriovorax stolpii TaxID=960 RepID=A0A2K9NNI2_BACTC|nr:succinate dehydrogenase/fumarate reductase iron-sulfur subunit [Bacteriovorax stolpii]AUN97057.1 succinate dehydrogenase/fumarate reductase iron-sulfur subunit [Bacteriovorax stolpii]QDK43007.1 succinate dehydrogenase/fumarate reductase iron-sulfur subunit [Bacteriovorax stolpii]TDP53344.1 succinate dehydrogenase / fumarate reductase iron-sulfur subunit [Bacteriovorax stolpii]
MKINFKIWRQNNSKMKGHFKVYPLENITADMSLLEALDLLNEELVEKGETAVAFDHDCREGICGQCGIFINGRAHGPHDNQTTCQVHMRSFEDQSTIVLEPFRANAFPIVKDLVVNRSSFDRIIQKGGFISANTGGAPEANSIPIGKERADYAMDMAACIGCGACVATCKNASAALFTSAKINHLNALPQGNEEALSRTYNLVEQMQEEGFGHCSFTGACEVECPEHIPLTSIAKMNFDYMKAVAFKK